MGYTTDFSGGFKFSKPLTAEQKTYLVHFNETRRMRRDVHILSRGRFDEFKDSVREAVGLPIGNEGMFYVGSHSKGFRGQERDASVIDYNEPPMSVSNNMIEDFNEYWKENDKRREEGISQPGLWCGWVRNEEGTELIWDGGEKFSYYIQWLEWLIKNIFDKWDIKLNGLMFWKGEGNNDNGGITVMDSVVTVNTYTDEEFSTFSPFEPREVYE